MKVRELHDALKLSWHKYTAKGYWTPACPCLNQCAVTALVVQDYFGGELLRCKTEMDDSHYWNRLPDGSEIDFTFFQFEFSKDKPFKDQFVVRDREYVLSYPDTEKRYRLLKDRVEYYLDKMGIR